MTEIIVRSTPRLYFWFLGIVVYPAGGIVFTAVLVRPVLLWLGLDLRGRPLILVWLFVTALVAGWAYLRDYRRVHYTLSADFLAVGRGAAATIVPFDEIESIVIGLPPRLPWWIRLQRFNPLGRGLYHGIIQARERTMLLRLTNHRYLPLNLAYHILANGPALMGELIQRNPGKIVGQGTYTGSEVRGLASVVSNSVKTIDRGTHHESR